MTDIDLVELVREAILTGAVAVLPVLAVGLAVGLVTGLAQAATGVPVDGGADGGAVSAGRRPVTRHSRRLAPGGFHRPFMQAPLPEQPGPGRGFGGRRLSLPSRPYGRHPRRSRSKSRSYRRDRKRKPHIS